MLWMAHYFPSILPTVEWFVFGMQYRFSPGWISDGVEQQRTGLLMDCLFSQFVNEWAVPFSKGPEIIDRLSKWINGDEKGSGIPFSSRGVYVHCPIEVRVTHGSAERNPTRGFLDPTMENEPTLYLNATLYRPYGLNPPCRERYYQAFEWLMKQYGGRPHWAKNFSTVTNEDLKSMYSSNLRKWLAVRKEVDPDGLFVGAWHRKYLLGEHEKEPATEFEEEELSRQPASDGGMTWHGRQRLSDQIRLDFQANKIRTSRSDESFDFVDVEAKEGS